MFFQQEISDLNRLNNVNLQTKYEFKTTESITYSYSINKYAYIYIQIERKGNKIYNSIIQKIKEPRPYNFVYCNKKT